MRIAIVANGELKDRMFYENNLEKADVIICADGGANKLLEWNITPDYVIGDMDSIRDHVLERLKKKIKVIFDSDQDKTDMMRAIGLANSLNPAEITIFGAIGDNIDHTLSNLICLDQIDRKIKARILDEKNEIFLVDSELKLEGKEGDIISIIPLTDAEGLSYEGLKWSLKNKDVGFGWFGTRNRMTGNKCRISLKKGKLLVIRVRE
jgi:thiamine pyrophosphokinase